MTSVRSAGLDFSNLAALHRAEMYELPARVRLHRSYRRGEFVHKCVCSGECSLRRPDRLGKFEVY